jgi:hypothetical protein
MVGTVAAYDVPNYWATGLLQFACYDQQLVCCVDDFCMAPMAA